MNKSANLFWGVGLIVAAILFLLYQLGYIVSFNLFTYILSAFLGYSLFKGIQRKKISTIIFSFGGLYYFLHGYFMLPYLHFISLFFICLLLSIGFSLIFNKKPKMYANFEWDDFKYNNYTSSEDEVFYEFVDDEKIISNFSSTEKYINDEDFKHLNIESSFSSVKVYFGDAHIIDNQATVNVDISFGSATLFIPKNWAIKPNIHNTFGGVKISGKPVNPDKTLHIVGDVNFSSLEIIFI